MRILKFLLVVVVISGAGKAVHGQWAVYDAANHAEGLLNQVNTYLNQANTLTSMKTIIDLNNRYGGGLSKVTGFLQKLSNTMETINKTVSSIKRLAVGDLFGISQVAKQWGLPEDMVKIGTSLGSIYYAYDNHQKTGTDFHAIRGYVSAIGSLERAIYDYQKNRNQQRARENAQVAQARVEAADQMIDSSKDTLGPEGHIVVTNELLSKSLENDRDLMQMQLEETNLQEIEARTRRHENEMQYESARMKFFRSRSRR